MDISFLNNSSPPAGDSVPSVSSEPPRAPVPSFPAHVGSLNLGRPLRERTDLFSGTGTDPDDPLPILTAKRPAAAANKDGFTPAVPPAAAADGVSLLAPSSSPLASAAPASLPFRTPPPPPPSPGAGGATPAVVKPRRQPGPKPGTRGKKALEAKAAAAALAAAASRAASTPASNVDAGMRRRLETEAYAALVTALRSQGELTWRKAQLLTDMRALLHISDDFHRHELSRVEASLAGGASQAAASTPRKQHLREDGSVGEVLASDASDADVVPEEQPKPKKFKGILNAYPLPTCEKTAHLHTIPTFRVGPVTVPSSSVLMPPPTGISPAKKERKPRKEKKEKSADKKDAASLPAFMQFQLPSFSTSQPAAPPSSASAASLPVASPGGGPPATAPPTPDFPARPSFAPPRLLTPTQGASVSGPMAAPRPVDQHLPSPSPLSAMSSSFSSAIATPRLVEPLPAAAPALAVSSPFASVAATGRLAEPFSAAAPRVPPSLPASVVPSAPVSMASIASLVSPMSPLGPTPGHPNRALPPTMMPSSSDDPLSRWSHRSDIGEFGYSGNDKQRGSILNPPPPPVLQQPP